MRINIVSIFPGYFEAPLSLSIPGRAAEAGLVEYRLIDLRDSTSDRHRTVDDVPYGGGAGMVLKPEPFFEAVDDLAPTGQTVRLAADQVFKAIGQTLAGDNLPDLDGRKIAVTSAGRTSIAGIWAGGDCAAGGDDLTVTAVAEGRDAAEDIHETLVS